MSLRKEDISITSSLTALDLNSLVSVEIRRWWRQNLGLEISVLQITSLDSVQQLGVLPIDSLREKHLGGEGQDPAAKKYMTFTKMHFSTHNPGSVQRMIYSFRFWYVSQA
ncbi:hypothetical protein AnigIFM49718_001386 [Aspergillus niger]|nr:hypothetical protein AnigIFM49718_001386 [Aspergillus niger]